MKMSFLFLIMSLMFVLLVLPISYSQLENPDIVYQITLDGQASTLPSGDISAFWSNLEGWSAIDQLTPSQILLDLLDL